MKRKWLYISAITFVISVIVSYFDKVNGAALMYVSMIFLYNSISKILLEIQKANKVAGDLYDSMIKTSELSRKYINEFLNKAENKEEE